jgi:hypothetical protein
MSYMVSRPRATIRVASIAITCFIFTSGETCHETCHFETATFCLFLFATGSGHPSHRGAHLCLSASKHLASTHVYINPQGDGKEELYIILTHRSREATTWPGPLLPCPGRLLSCRPRSSALQTPCCGAVTSYRTLACPVAMRADIQAPL